MTFGEQIELTVEQQKTVITMMEYGASFIGIVETIGISLHQLNGFRKRNPEFEARVDAARKYSADIFADKALKISEREDIHPGIQRNQIDINKWMASKRNAATYGDKLELNTKASIDISLILDDSDRRLAALNAERFQSGPVIDLIPEKTENLQDLQELQSVEPDSAVKQLVKRSKFDDIV